jgi:hypothetical protein
MAEAARDALSFVQRRQRGDLDTDTMLRFALTRAMVHQRLQGSRGRRGAPPAAGR